MKFFPLKFTVEEPPAPKKKSKKGALITLAVALLILLASGALFLARLRKRRRAAEVASLFADAGIIVLASFITPTNELRDIARGCLGEKYNEVFVKASLEACISRDPKGLYEKAKNGIIPEFTGISAPFEEPASPDLTIETDIMDIERCINALLEYLADKKYIF